MEVQVTAATAKNLTDLAETSGRAPEEIVETSLPGTWKRWPRSGKRSSAATTIESGRVNPIDGEGAFRALCDESERRPR